MALEGAVALDFVIDGFFNVGTVDELLLEINTEALLLALEGAVALDFSIEDFSMSLITVYLMTASAFAYSPSLGPSALEMHQI